MTATVPPGPPPPPPPPGAPAPPPARPRPQGRGCWFYGCLIAVVLLLVVIATAVGTAWWVKRNTIAGPMDPVVLTEPEETALEQKLERLGGPRRDTGPEPPGSPTGAMTVPLDDEFARRPVIITEREINGLIGHNTDLADKVRVSLNQDRIDVRVHFPIPEEAPVLGGQVFRLNLRTRLVLRDRRLQLTLEEVAIGGIPIPNAWIQDAKGRDLLAQYQEDERLRTLMEGIEHLEIQDGQIVFVPAE